MKTMNRMSTYAAFLATGILWIALISAAFAAEAQNFASPKAAEDALVAALRSQDRGALSTILGSAGSEIVYSGDSTADGAAAKRFLDAYDSHSTLVSKDANHAMISVGLDNWTLPIPIVKTAAGWHFDAAAGKTEMLARRIGRNELYAIQACLAYVDAQREYASADRGAGVLAYAQRFTSSSGKHDGLYWSVSGNAPQSPLGPAFAQAQAQGYGQGSGPRAVNVTAPYRGYVFKILTGQGPAAKGGAYDYVANGKMIGGYALVAYPAVYGSSGYTTFIVNQDGVVYQNDLGPGTPTIASEMTKFNPSKGWVKAQ
jgi:hypothetical protein